MPPSHPPAAEVCLCLGDDPTTARQALKEATTTDRITDESHFIVSLLRCERCWQPFLKIFSELIDWTNGDDAQAWLYVPLYAAEVDKLRAAKPVDDRFLLDLNINRRYLSDVFPSGAERRIAWGSGPLMLLPHD